MNSEKVKEIKYYLEQSACMYGNMQNQALTLINELESENIQRQKLIDAYSEENERLYDDIHKKGMKGLEEQNEKNLILIDNQKDRIAELEDENEKLRSENKILSNKE